MRKLLAAAAISLGLATPAQATEWLICGAGEGGPSFSVLLGSLGIGLATDFKVEANGKFWSTTPGEGIAIAKSQAFDSGAMLLADVRTEDQSELVAELRLFTAAEGDSLAYGGTLRIPGVGAWAVDCPAE